MRRELKVGNIVVSMLLLMMLLLSGGCSSTSKRAPTVHNDRVGTVTAEHEEFQKDARECSLEENNKLQSTSSATSSEGTSSSKDLKDVIGSNSISNILILYLGMKNAHEEIDRIGKCIEGKGWTIVSQQN